MGDGMKRLLDVTLASLGLLVASPFLVPVMVWIYLTDWHLPFYVAPRVGKDGRLFRISKLRSMKAKDITGGDDYLEANLGSLLKSRLLGEFWVSRSTLPKMYI